MSKRRVVITGMGVVSPLGCSVAETWEAILQGQSGVTPIDDFDCSAFATHFSASVKGFDSSLSLSVKLSRRVDLFMQYAVEASRQALLDTGVELPREDYLSRFGVTIGSGIGGMQVIQDNCQKLFTSGPRKISPFFIPGNIINMASGLVSMQYKLRGPNVSLVSACASGNHNIGFAARLIAYGDADWMLAGGAEKASSGLGVGGFNAIKALSTRNDEPTKASRPWDKDRDGFVIGDGAGVLVLEEYEHAKARGATVYAELVGFGMSADAYHMTAGEPGGVGLQLCMENALHDAGLNPEDIDYINAHGTSTPLADPIEALAIKKVFKGYANQLAVSSTKSMTGHLLGAAGAIESIFSILAIRDGVAPPTINLDNPDEGCDLDFVPHQARSMAINTVLSNSFGFGGSNCSLIFKRVE